MVFRHSTASRGDFVQGMGKKHTKNKAFRIENMVTSGKFVFGYLVRDLVIIKALLFPQRDFTHYETCTYYSYLSCLQVIVSEHVITRSYFQRNETLYP